MGHSTMSLRESFTGTTLLCVQVGGGGTDSTCVRMMTRASTSDGRASLTYLQPELLRPDGLPWERRR